MRIVWAPLAIERAAEQARYIAEDKPEAGRRWLGDLFTSVAKLSKFPRLGRPVPELARADLRELDFRGYRVIYRVEKRQISILTVRHGRRLLDPSEVNR